MDLFVPPDRARALAASARSSIVVDSDQLPMLELLVSGALAPLTGFMDAFEAAHVAEHQRLPNGVFWPMPIVLELPWTAIDPLEDGQVVILREPEGDAVAALHLAGRWPTAPTGAGERRRVAGRVEGLNLPRHYDFAALRRTSRATRAALAERGWSRALCCPLDRGVSVPDQEALVRAATAAGAGLVLQAALDTSNHADERPFNMMRALAAGARPEALVSVVPWHRSWPVSSVTGDPVWAAFGAVVARNHGCTHVLVTTEAAAALEARGIGADDLGVVPIASRVVADSPVESPAPGGTTIFFTGLSGSGKSTIANAVRVRLMERGVRVTLLDGDLVRRHLSSELGYSREHRELNVLRIGYVAAEITKHGGIAICAPIAPYADVRARVREGVETVGRFVLVFVDTPVDICEARDPKGLYARARAGLIPEFTGVSDPYEPPVDADLVIRTTEMTSSEAADLVVRLVLEGAPRSLGRGLRALR